MEKKHVSSALELLGAVAPREFVEMVEEDNGISGSGVYTAFIVMWLMSYQWLRKKASLSDAVNELLKGPTKRILSNHKRVRENKLSLNTGAYSQARSRLPLELVETVVDYICERMSEKENHLWQDKRAYILDGSTLQLEHTKELAKAFPPNNNQYGKSHWPLMYICVATDLMTGVCQRPEYGAMYGTNAVSETKLGRALMGRLEPSSIIVGDRGFGIFSVAYEATRCGHDVLLRVTNSRAKSLCKGSLPSKVDAQVTWRPSRYDLSKNTEIPEDSEISGRLIQVNMQGAGKNEALILFTTLTNAAVQELVDLYARRWNVELDIRSLKQTLNMRSLPGKTKDMVIKELLMGIVAYNIIRHIISIAAEIYTVDPRRISFSRAAHMLTIVGEDIEDTFDDHKRIESFEDALRYIGMMKIPKRKRKQTYPRKVYRPTLRYQTKPCSFY